jgi:Zn-dependent peptidase ImmA (M78 family)/transcriptional regulator with XRE-family HTH domain
MGANHEMLILARQARGITQAKLAKNSGVSQGTISKIESGNRPLSEDDVAKFSAALRYPPEFFERNAKQYGQGTVCHHRKLQSVGVEKLRQVHASMNITRMATADLLNGVEINPTYSIPRLEVDDFGGPEEIARLIRQTWQIPLGPIKSMTEIVEDAGGIVVPCDFGTDKIDAISQRPDGQPPFLFVSVSTPGDRLRFSLAHELGHIIMHSAPAPNQEDEANAFAAEFLMPAREIKPQLRKLDMAKLADLKRHWKVSMQALIYRARTLETITARQERSWWMRFNKLGYKKVEPIEIPREEPTLIKRVIEFHRSQHGYTDAELSRAARLVQDEFQGIYGTREKPKRHLGLVPVD